jgi:transcriptional regulator with XRE-family HTH domain
LLHVIGFGYTRYEFSVEKKMNKKSAKETLGQRLQRLRQAANMTQGQLAEQSGQSFGNLKNWERDYRTPGLWAALTLAKALGVALEELAECAEPDPKAASAKRNKRARQEGGRQVGRPKVSGASGSSEVKPEMGSGTGGGRKGSRGAARSQGQK